MPKIVAEIPRIVSRKIQTFDNRISKPPVVVFCYYAIHS
jgi:hypothetical protein